MEKETYYLKLQELLDRIKNLKTEILNSKDEEKIKYLKLAVESVNIEMREFMELYHK